MSDYEAWKATFPDAAYALESLLTRNTQSDSDADGYSEAWAQQRVRHQIAARGGLAWRNNVGATPAKEQHKCPRCFFDFETKKQPTRYGLANDSAKMNKNIKSSDIIGVIPVQILPEHVGQTFGLFVAVEMKRPGWKYTGKGREAAQAAFLSLCRSVGAHAEFSTGEFNQ